MLLGCAVILASVLTLTGSNNNNNNNNNNNKDKGLNADPLALSSQQQQIYSYPDRFPLSVLHLEVVAILPNHSKRSLSLARTLSRTLNSVTAADLVSQLDFPEKNVTWTVRNFVVDGESRGSSFTGVSKERLISHNINNNNNGHRSDLLVDNGSEGEEDEEEDDDYEYLGDEGSKGAKVRVPFAPRLLNELCEFLEGGRALVLVTLLPDAPSERLLSLVSATTAIPLIGNSHALSHQKDEDELYLNVWSSVRELARAVALLLVHCHWHSFTVLFDDSPSMVSSQLVWRQELRSKVIIKSTSSNSSGPASDYYPDMDYHASEEKSEEDENQWLLHPNYITIQTRFSNSAFRSLSELTKATQGVILLVLSQRSALAVFNAAKQLRMLNGDYTFIMVGPYSQFEKIPDWIPHGVLAIRSPRLSSLNKWKMRSTGTMLASALSQIKDEPFMPPSSSSLSNKGRAKGTAMGGSFSGFTNRDFVQEGQLDFVGEAEEEENDVKGPPQATVLEILEKLPNLSCWQQPPDPNRKQLSIALTREMRGGMSRTESPSPGPGSHPVFDIINLLRREGASSDLVGGSSTFIPQWQRVGSVSPHEAHVSLHTIRWPGGGIFGPDERPSKAYRVVTIVAPPFVMESQAEDNKTCVRGLPCLKVNTPNKDTLAVLFAEFETRRPSGDYELTCCDGLAMDLLTSIGRELKFEIDLFLVPDGYFGSRSADGSWNGLMGALVSGAAHMCFAPFSVTSVRATGVDFSTPFFFSGVGLLGISKERDVPLLAFLAPFSPTLWAAIFITLNLTALVVAIYEWFSPFGLNPWGRQRTKNFSISSALWVVWGRLFSHLVAFKAPKSWPNKFLINVWGGFSVIFVASYTANIAALFAGMFFERHVDVNDRSLLSQRVTAIKHSATDFYIKRENPHLWEHIQQFPVQSFHQGVQMLKNGSLDLLIGDGPLLDYFRGTDSSCSLIDVSDHDKIGDDTYAVAMTRGFPLKESVSGVISKYIENGYLDYLQGKWYGQMPCFSKNQQAGARALGVDAVVGMLIMLGVAMILGILISLLELLIFKHALPFWRAQPKGTLWRSPNLMFFSQKLYRFINCVELVSPHHAAKELAKTLRQGQITSLFQKSVKRKEHEQRRRRKSKAQFYEMIQEIKRVQMAEKKQGAGSRAIGGDDESGSSTVYSIQGRLDKELYLPPRLAQQGGEEILIADYPQGERVGPQGAPSSLDDPPSTSTSDNAATALSTRRIQWRCPTGGGNVHRMPAVSSPAPPHGILRTKATFGCRALEVTAALNTEMGIKGGQQDESDDEEGEVSDVDEDSYELYSPLDKADLKGMSKGQIIEMWRASELDLRRQLSQALKAKDELSVALSRAETPAMVVEFDQVKI